jgi:hypothetical protein
MAQSLGEEAFTLNFFCHFGLIILLYGITGITLRFTANVINLHNNKSSYFFRNSGKQKMIII